MRTFSGTNGIASGALTVIFGMLLGGLAVLVIQRYTTLEKQRVLKEAYKFHEDKRP